MQEPAATLEASGTETQTAANPPILRHAGGGAVRFTYPSGSRPLDGYTIKRGIGVGGFGEVYFATSDAGKEVALKRVQRNLEVEVRGVTQCLNLKHPNLIALYDIRYDDEGTAWVVMEIVPGESLKDVTERFQNGMPHDDMLGWFRGIAAGVTYLHDHGIVHRDLKPGNIFIDEDVIKIGDYGLSKFISCSRRSGQTESVGTFHYMAPEIGKGVYGKEIDIYALGIILYEMLTGRVPFEGESSQEIIMKHLTADPDLTGIPAPYHEMIQRALLKDPDQRFKSVREMIACLDGEQAGLTSPDRAASTKSDRTPPSDPPSGGQPDKVLFIGEDVPEDIAFGPVKDNSGPAAPGIQLGDLQEKPGSTPRQPPPQNPNPNSPKRGTSHRNIARSTRPTEPAMIGFGQWWSHSRGSTILKFLLVALVVGILVAAQSVVLPIGAVLAAGALIYFGSRAAIGALSGPAIAARGDRPVRRSRPWQEVARQSLRQRPAIELLSQWTGSLLGSATIVGVLGLIMLLVGGVNVDDSVYTWSLYAWLSLTSVTGAWTILTLGKFWENREGDRAHRRFFMLAAGLFVGIVAWFAQQTLVFELPTNGNGAFAEFGMPSMLFSNGVPQPAAFLVFFGGIFLLLRWWKMADPLRGSRLSLWATAMCALWGWIIPFAQPWGMLVAASMAVAVQLAAPWMTADERDRIKAQAQGA